MANMSSAQIPSAVGAGLLDVETIWQMALPTLLHNNSQLVLAEHIAGTLSEAQVNELRARLSQFCGHAPTIVYRDAEGNGLVISISSGYQAPSVASSESLSPVNSTTTPSPASMASPSEEMSNSRSRSPGKKSKVPRPPNAFILYRQNHHPKLKAAHPDMHNNEISVILGKQWHNEPDSVKSVWRLVADKIKRKHAEQNPGYQYAPRKPAEKKRRMTARKIAARKAMTEQTPPPVFPSAGIVDVADHGLSEFEGHVATAMDNDIWETSAIPLTHASTWLGTTRPSPNADILRVDDDTLDVSLSLPAAQQQLDDQVGAHYHGVNGLLPFGPHEFSTAPTSQATNEQDFLNSLIDWDGIRQDMEIIRHSSTEDRDNLVAVETGTTQQLSWDAVSTDEVLCLLAVRFSNANPRQFFGSQT